MYPYKLQSFHQHLSNDTAKQKNLQGEFLRNSQMLHSGFSASCGQMRLNFYCMEQLIFITVKSGYKVYAYTEESLHSQCVTAWCGFTLSIILCSLKSTVQKQDGCHALLLETAA